MPSKHRFYASNGFSRLASPRSSFYIDRNPPPRIPQHESSDTGSWDVAALASQLQALQLGIDSSLTSNPSTPPEHRIIQHLKPFLPVECELLGQGDVKIVGSFPIDAGGFADVWVGERNDGTVVAIKSHRYYSSSSWLPMYFRLCKEVLTCVRLTGNQNVVSFIGVYSTPKHPFALVFEFMDQLNLRGYLWETRTVKRMELLLEIARGLMYMHSLGIAHGNLKITNILVDGDGNARIGGLGMASILCAMPIVDMDPSFASPKIGRLIGPRRWGSTDHGATMESDVYEFAVLAWEVFARRIPFSGESVVMAFHSTANGRRLKRPDHPELSNGVWKLIKRCWGDDPAKRNTMAEVVIILETEISAYKSK